jgi:hypothetical protein
MQFSRRLLITIAVCFGLLSVVVAFAVRTRTEAAHVAQSNSEQGRFEAERVTVREWGFEPTRIKRSPGPFVLILQNQSGLGEIDLSLVEESGRQKDRLAVTRNLLTSKQRLDLPPGTYLIKEAGHPEWQCQITIGK